MAVHYQLVLAQVSEEAAQGGRSREGGGRGRFFLCFAPTAWADHPKLPPMKKGGQDMGSWGP